MFVNTLFQDKVKKFLTHISLKNMLQKHRKYKGIVITERVCDIRDILAPVEVSIPYAAGKITVLRPKGMATVQRARVSI